MLLYKYTFISILNSKLKLERYDFLQRKNVMIIGAAGRDFHNFNVVYRDDERYNVVAFTATQIPNIDDRRYPPSLAGRLYPKGIPIYSQEELPTLIKTRSEERRVGKEGRYRWGAGEKGRTNLG